MTDEGAGVLQEGSSKENRDWAAFGASFRRRLR
jgi:hypothetical protein